MTASTISGSQKSRRPGSAYLIIFNISNFQMIFQIDEFVPRSLANLDRSIPKSHCDTPRPTRRDNQPGFRFKFYFSHIGKYFKIQRVI